MLFACLFAKICVWCEYCLLYVMPEYPQGVVWTKWHYAFAIICPVPMVLLVLLAAKGWSGFAIMVGVVPLVTILIGIGSWHHTC